MSKLSEFGNETATAAFKTSEKAIDAILRLFKFISASNERKLNNALKEAQLAGIQGESAQKLAQMELAGKAGFVNYKQLEATGEKIKYAEVSVDDKIFEMLNNEAQKCDLLFSSVSNQRETGEKKHLVCFLAKDEAKFMYATKNVVENAKYNLLESKKNGVVAKGNLTEEDLEVLEALCGQQEKSLRADTKSFNDQNAELVFEELRDQMKDSALSFDTALNKFTDRGFRRDKPYYICERTNPDSHMILNSEAYEYKGKHHVQTDYRVFKDGKEQVPEKSIYKGKYSDRRYDGRPRDFWKNLKQDMKEAGGFSDDVVAFNSKEEFEHYANLYKQYTSAKEVKENSNAEHRDFNAVIQQLKQQLDDYGVYMTDEHIPADKETGDILPYNGHTSIEDKAKAQECYMICDQIQNYEESRIFSTEYEIAKTETFADDMQRKNVLQTFEQKLEELKVREKELKEARNQISGIKAVNEVDKEYTKAAEKSMEIEPDAAYAESWESGVSTDEIRKEIRNEQQKQAMERDEFEEWQANIPELETAESSKMSIDDWKEEIDRTRQEASQGLKPELKARDTQDRDDR